jgi:hypothetical protein
MQQCHLWPHSRTQIMIPCRKLDECNQCYISLLILGATSSWTCHPKREVVHDFNPTRCKGQDHIRTILLVRKQVLLKACEFVQFSFDISNVCYGQCYFSYSEPLHFGDKKIKWKYYTANCSFLFSVINFWKTHYLECSLLLYGQFFLWCSPMRKLKKVNK